MKATARFIVTDRFIGQQFAAWLGHPEVRAETKHDWLRGKFEIRVGPVRVQFPTAVYRRLQSGPILDMPREFEACLARRSHD